MKFFYLPSCSTCARIMKEINLPENCKLIDIKSKGIPKTDLAEMAKIKGSYESLFSRRAMKYKSMGLKEKTLSEDDYKSLILDEYTFLKRPVLLVDGESFVGNAKKNVAAMKAKIDSL